MQLLRSLVRESGKTAIVVTHDQRIFRYADRVCRLEDGRLVEDEMPLEVASRQRRRVPHSAVTSVSDPLREVPTTIRYMP